MDPVIEVDLNDTLNNFVRKKRGKTKTKNLAMKKSEKLQKNKVQEKATSPKESLPRSAVDDQRVFDVAPGITVSLFDYSVDHHFEAIDTICRLSGEPKSCEIGEGVVDRLSSSFTFLREWKHFNYPPRVLRFASQNKDNTEVTDIHGEITLPQFSAATVPKNSDQDGSMISPELRKDFVLYVGGLVWALDWCPRVHHKSDSQVKCEFIAVAAHPPESSYHKVGAPLIGRGLIQIWCFLNFSREEEEDSPNKSPTNKAGNKPKTEATSSEPKKPRGRPRKYPLRDTELSEPKKPRGRPRKDPDPFEKKKPRGRPRKIPMDIVVENSNDNIQYVEALSVKSPESSSTLLLTDRVSADSGKCERRVSARKNKGHHSRILEDDAALLEDDAEVSEYDAEESEDDAELSDDDAEVSEDDAELISPLKKCRLKDKAKVVSVTYGESLSLLPQQETIKSVPENPVTCSNAEVESSSVSILKSCASESRGSGYPIPKDVALPRVVLCLAHNGKVAWDVKWQPNNVDDTAARHRLGYLAVLLGNGALEVWEVPTPQTVKTIYSSRQKKETDPRFLKLEPVFRCSKVKCGDRQSIPITLEWSTSAPHDLIMAGCHDGVVALWKFAANHTSEDSRPLLCFSAHTDPVRALAWAPTESGPDSANVVVTAGSNGLKFWDIRDPFRTLWHFPIQQNIFSLDWLPDPGCVIVSFDDGAVRILSLVNAANDVPVTGEPFAGTEKKGFHIYSWSSFAIWCVQVSRLTGLVAYCGADGTVLQFQLTHKAVEKDPRRNKAPHFLCGSLSVDESAFVVTSPSPNTQFPTRTTRKECANAPRTIQGFISAANKEKIAKEKMVKGNMPEDQSQDLCHGDDSDTGSQDFTLPSKKSKSKANSRDTALSDIALVSRGEDQTQREDSGEEKTKFEKLPPKLVSMHKVRWNMNKGSEKWLCSGGAAGILRLQEIQPPSTKKYKK